MDARSGRLLAVAALGVALLSAAVGIFVFHAVPVERRASSVTVHVLMVAIPCMVGILAWAEGGEARFGRRLAATGVLFALAALAESPDPTVHALGRIAAWFIEAAMVYLLLAFPSGRLDDPWARRLFAASLVLLATLYLPTVPFVDQFPEPSPWGTCGADCPPNGLTVVGSEPGIIDAAIRPLREVLTFLVYAAVAAVVIRRAATSGPLLRRAVLPVAAIAGYRALAFMLYTLVRRNNPHAAGLDLLAGLYLAALPLLALSFGLGILLRRVYAAVALQRLALRLGPSAGRRELRIAMAAALEDPSLQLLTWRIGDPGGWVDEGGWPAAVPRRGGPSDVTEVRADGRPVAMIIQDRRLGQDPVVVRAAGSYAMAILENRRLVERLQSSLGDLSRSRARLMAIADETRRRIERDLHDGAQQRLIGLRIKLSVQREKLEVDSPSSAAALAAMGDDVQESIDELRALAHGIYPSLLGDRGLPEALRAIAREAAIPTAIDSDGVGRYPPEVESTVYFACLEALQNAEKHATGATQVSIHLRDEGGLSFEVRDDGAGFEVAGAADDSGFTSLHDRLEAVGGRLEVRSNPGAGTTVRGLIPVEPGGH